MEPAYSAPRCFISPLHVPESHTEQHREKQNKEIREQNWASQSLRGDVRSSIMMRLSESRPWPCLSCLTRSCCLLFGDTVQLDEARVITSSDCITKHWDDACKLKKKKNEGSVDHGCCLFSRLHPKANSSGTFNTTSFIWHQLTLEQIQGLT